MSRDEQRVLDVALRHQDRLGKVKSDLQLSLCYRGDVPAGQILTDNLFLTLDHLDDEKVLSLGELLTLLGLK